MPPPDGVPSVRHEIQSNKKVVTGDVSSCIHLPRAKDNGGSGVDQSVGWKVSGAYEQAVLHMTQN
jgi:hypothetical protein